MAYDECQAGRFRRALTGKSEIAEKRMMGGLIFLLNGNMIGGVDIDPSGADRFMFRVGRECMADALSRPGAEPVIMAGRRMNGFVFVLDCDQPTLEDWISLALRFVDELPPKS
jgi:TfoX N-terminal domain